MATNSDPVYLIQDTYNKILSSIYSLRQKKVLQRGVWSTEVYYSKNVTTEIKYQSNY